MKVIYKCAAILTAAILSVQFPCAAFADVEHGGDNDSLKFKMGRIIFTDNGYGYEKEGLEKSEIADEDLSTRTTGFHLMHKRQRLRCLRNMTPDLRIR
ncbi:hypothetical protein DW964_09075 [Ruminococcus sp. AM47-2BH]|nr:hypothetical protein DW964_09075 [Ruminococcus sp. AM47-2BH]